MTQPEALRLAQALNDRQDVYDEAAAELRRLHEVNRGLIEALHGMLVQFTKTPSSLKDSEVRCKAHAAIAKATGEQA